MAPRALLTASVGNTQCRLTPLDMLIGNPGIVATLRAHKCYSIKPPPYDKLSLIGRAACFPSSPRQLNRPAPICFIGHPVSTG